MKSAKADVRENPMVAFLSHCGMVDSELAAKVMIALTVSAVGMLGHRAKPTFEANQEIVFRSRLCRE
jgi:hypothetical protein